MSKRHDELGRKWARAVLARQLINSVLVLAALIMGLIVAGYLASKG